MSTMCDRFEVRVHPDKIPSTSRRSLVIVLLIAAGNFGFLSLAQKVNGTGTELSLMGTTVGGIVAFVAAILAALIPPPMHPVFKLAEEGLPLFAFTEQGVVHNNVNGIRVGVIPWANVSHYLVHVTTDTHRKDGAVRPLSICLKISDFDKAVESACSTKDKQKVVKYCELFGGAVPLALLFGNASINEVHDELVKRLTPEQVANSLYCFGTQRVHTNGILPAESFSLPAG